MNDRSGFAVLHAGALTMVQDLGRPGFAHIGVPRSGAADRGSLQLANRLVGNPENAACLESTMIGPRLQLTGACTFALTGAAVEATLDGAEVAMNSPVHADAGTVLTVGTAAAGLRTYIAFRGGIDCDPVLGSRSTDIRSGIGPAPLKAGDHLTLGPATGAFPDVDQAPVQPLERHPALRIVLGPRDAMFSSEALHTLLTQPFTVASSSNRIGVRLEGPALGRRDRAELASEGMAAGSIQVPPDGRPIILLADHPTTGGYPVIAVVHSTDLDLVGQLRPGQQIGFRAHAAHGKQREPPS